MTAGSKKYATLHLSQPLDLEKTPAALRQSDIGHSGRWVKKRAPTMGHGGFDETKKLGSSASRSLNQSPVTYVRGFLLC